MKASWRPKAEKNNVIFEGIGAETSQNVEFLSPESDVCRTPCNCDFKKLPVCKKPDIVGGGLKTQLRGKLDWELRMQHVR